MLEDMPASIIIYHLKLPVFKKLSCSMLFKNFKPFKIKVFGKTQR